MAVGVLLAGGIFLLAADYLRSVRETDGSIQRNTYGQGNRTEELEVSIAGGEARFPAEIQVAEQQYSTEEIQELFQRVIRHMEKLIL